ncbi:Hat family dimerization protein [Fusarium oxysporum f. sp. albedinis]|nr:Hat family dimerization protein [Fusarium oxysporum f. sp. albedinis]
MCLVDIRVQASELFVRLRFFSPAITVQSSDSFDRSPCQRVLLVYILKKSMHPRRDATSHTKSSDVASARLSLD